MHAFKAGDRRHECCLSALGMDCTFKEIIQYGTARGLKSCTIVRLTNQIHVSAICSSCCLMKLCLPCEIQQIIIHVGGGESSQKGMQIFLSAVQTVFELC